MPKLFFAFALLLLTSVASAIDPASVQREGPAYRYPQAGWIIVHVEGEPYERGYQQGKLLAPEIAGYIRCYAATQSSKAPADGWRLTRTLVNSILLHRFDAEYLEEMRGIADGAAAAGAKFDGRAIDLIDIVAVNAWAEVMSLDPANDATPNGMEGKIFKYPGHCSAFAAIGPATSDGKIVIGHTSMFDLYPSLFFNIWLDVKPAKGHRMSFQGFPGAISSGMDYYQTDAGLVVVETTIDQTKFNPAGESESSRIRKAVQYADSIDDCVKLLSKENNGLYSNEWLLADTKKNEIAMFELGTGKSKLWRSGNKEWFGNTEGFYWSCNNTKDLKVRLEAIPSTNDRPANMVFRPEIRDGLWVKLYQQYRGHINADFAKLAFTTPPLVSHESLDAKFTTSDLNGKLECQAIFGPPLGRAWQPTNEERSKYPEVYAMASNPWTTLSMNAVLPDAPTTAPIDLPGKTDAVASKSDEDDGDDPGGAKAPAWHGTLLPGTDADLWLATAFAAFEPIEADELPMLKDRDSLLPDQGDEIGNRLFAYRSSYLAAARMMKPITLAAIKSDVIHDDWFRIARGRGVMLLQELRRRMGVVSFTELMESYGDAHQGTPADVAAFITMAGRAPYNVPASFFEDWIGTTTLPRFEIVKAEAHRGTAVDSFFVDGQLRISDGPPPTTVDITIESADDEKTQTVTIAGATVDFKIDLDKQPLRIIVDKYGLTPKANGGIYSLGWYSAEREKALIIYGTLDDAAANQEAGETLQRAIVEAWANVTIPVKSDAEVTDDELQNHHLILIGRPGCNRVTTKMATAFPVEFGSASFTVRSKLYANPNSVLLVAGTNPMNDRYSAVMVGGLSAQATLLNVKGLVEDGSSEARILANGEWKNLVLPARELVRALNVPH